MEKYDLSTLSNKYNEAIDSVRNRFDLLYKELSIYKDNNPIEYINYRVKEPNSIVEKLYRLSVPFSLENVENTLTDIIGVRIVCPFLDDLDRIIEIIKKMEEAGELKIKTVKDYVNKPKASGYSSYHIIVEMPVKIRGGIEKVNVELQIRTSAMDFYASSDHRIRYKKNTSNKYTDKLKSLSDICKKIDVDLNKFIMEIRKNSGIVSSDFSLLDNREYNKKMILLKASREYQLLKLKYEEAITKMSNKIDNICMMYEMNNMPRPIEHKKVRIKDDDEIGRKLYQKKKDITVDNVYNYVGDVAGIRLVCLTKRDLEELKVFISNDEELVIIEEKDYVNNPKESGYMGTHLIVGVPVYTMSGLSYVKVEIQIRTLAMEAWASLEEKICYRKVVPKYVSDELKRVSLVLATIDDDINKIVADCLGISLDDDVGVVKGNYTKKLERRENILK